MNIHFLKKNKLKALLKYFFIKIFNNLKYFFAWFAVLIEQTKNYGNLNKYFSYYYCTFYNELFSMNMSILFKNLSVSDP